MGPSITFSAASSFCTNPEDLGERDFLVADDLFFGGFGCSSSSPASDGWRVGDLGERDFLVDDRAPFGGLEFSSSFSTSDVWRVLEDLGEELDDDSRVGLRDLRGFKDRISSPEIDVSLSSELAAICSWTSLADDSSMLVELTTNSSDFV